MKYFSITKTIMAMALLLVIASCSREKDLFDQSLIERESAENFKNLVLGGRGVDPGQTWSTSSSSNITIESEISGTLKIYTANPIGKKTAPLLTQTINAGTYTMTVAKPADMANLYAALIDNDGTLRVMQIGDNDSTKFVASEGNAGSRTLRANKKGIDFPDAPDASLFATTLPSNTLTPDKYNNTSVHDYVLYETTNEQEVNFYAGNFNLYVTGNKTLKWSNPADGADNMFFYVLPGANLTFTGSTFSKNGAQRFKMFISPGATVTFNEGTNSCIHMYNKGTVIVKGYQASGIYGNGIIYNEGVMKFEGTGTQYQVVNPPYGGDNTSNALGIWNGEGRFVNAGTLESKGLLVEGSGKFLNLGKVNISGYTVVNSNNAVWINEGEYTTQDYAYSAGSQNVWNNCKLTVNNMFAIFLGDSDVNAFQMDGGSSVETKYLKMWGPSRIKMGGNSLLKVTEQAQLSCTKANYGIYGPEAGQQYAVFQAKDVVSVRNSWEAKAYEVSYGGKLYVATDSHFANGWSGQYPWYEQGPDVKMSESQTTAPYSIAASNCNPGYFGGGKIVPDPVMYYYYAFEDLGTTDDFDFNDVVIRLSAPVNGSSTVEIVAAGGTRETYVTYGEDLNITRLGAEVHNAMGVSSVKTMVNTDRVSTDNFATLGTIQVAPDAKIDQLPLGIEVKGNDGETVKVTRRINAGIAPLVIVVCGNEEGKWMWPMERVNITTAYRDFGEWGANVSNNKDWFRVATGAVVTY